MKKSLLSVLIMLGTWTVFAQVPGTLSYQGILVDNLGVPVADGTHFVQFHLYNVSTGGSPLYSSVGVGAGNQVTTFKGMFTFVIGSGSAGNNAIPSNIFDQQLYAEVVVNDGSPVVLTPRIALTTVPYSVVSQNANTVDAAGITGTIPNAALDADLVDLVDGTLTGSKVGPGIAAGNITGTLTLANGGTGATTAGAARTNLGLVIGTDVQAFDADLNDLADGSLSGSLVGTGINAANISTGTIGLANGGTGASTAANARTNLGLVIGTNVQAFDADLDDLADGTLTGSKVGTGIAAGNITSGTLALANGGTGASTATAARTNLGLVIGTDVQAFDADLDDLSDGTLTGSKVDGTTITGINAANIGSGTLGVARGGTGAITLTGALIGNGTGAITGVTHSAGSQYLRRNAGNTAYEFGALSVSNTEIADNAITNSKLADDAVTTTEIGTAGAGDANKVLTTDGSGNPQWELKTAVGIAGSGTAGQLALWSGTSSLSSDANLFWDNTNDRLGLGLATPSVQFQINAIAAAANRIKLSNTTTGLTGLDGLGLEFSASGLEGYLWNYENGPLYFGTNNLYRMTIDAAGNMGLGTTTPFSKLDVEGGVSIGTGYSGSIAAPTDGLIVQGRTGIGINAPLFPLDVNFQVGATSTKLGPGRAIFTVANSPMVGFNIYWGSGYTYNAAGTGGMITFSQEVGDGFSFNTAPSGSAGAAATMTSRMAITGGGNVGIGTASPSYLLHVNNPSTSTSSNGVYINNDYSGATIKNGLQIDVSATGTGQRNGIEVDVSGSATASTMYGLETDVNPNLSTATAYGVNASIPASGVAGSRYGLYTVVGTAAGTSGGMGVYGQINGSGTGTHYGAYGYADGAGTNYGLYGFAPAAEPGYAVYASGNLHVTSNITYAGTISDVSDQRLKRDIQPMPAMLSKVLQLKPSTFYFKTDEYKFMSLSEELQLGLIAQEVEEIFPEVVTDNFLPEEIDKEGKVVAPSLDYKGIDYTLLIPILIKSVQEQQGIIDQQNSSISQLKAELDELRKMVLANQKPAESQKTTASAGNEK